MLMASTGIRRAFAQAFADNFPDAVIRVYSGPQPANSDMAPTGTLLANITRNGLPVYPGNGFTFLVSPTGFVTRGIGEIWTLKGADAGVAGYCRLAAITDPPIFSSSAFRMDFDCNPDDGIGLLLTDPNITATLTRDVPYFLYGVPPITF